MRWRTVSVCKNYAVSSSGDIKRYSTGKLRALAYDKDGYARITIGYGRDRNTYQVHRLVAEAFIKKECDRLEVNHKNGDKSDNRVENLEWCTHSENLLHSYRVLNNNNKRR